MWLGATGMGVIWSLQFQLVQRLMKETNRKPLDSGILVTIQDLAIHVGTPISIMGGAIGASAYDDGGQLEVQPAQRDKRQRGL